MGTCVSHPVLAAKRVASVSDLLIVSVENNRFTYSSECGWLSVSESELVGKTVEEAFEVGLADCLKEPQSLKIGDRRRHRVRWTVIGRSVYALRSLTEEDTGTELMDELLAQTESLKALRTHFTDIPYHLNEPLRALISVSDTLSSISSAPRATGDVIKDIADAVDYSSPTVIHLNESITTLGRVVREVERSFDFRRADDSVRFEIDVDPEIVDLRLVFDSRAVVRVLSNLLDNSFKFTTEGRVHLSVTHEDGRHIRKFVRFAVSDTGSTIPEETVAALMEPVRLASLTRDRSQTEIIAASTDLGVGLQTVRRLVSALGGILKCERLEQGTRVSFVAPFIPYDLPVREISGRRTLSFNLPVAVRAQTETIEKSNVYVYSSSSHVRNDMESTLRALMFKSISIIRNGAKLVESLCDAKEAPDVIVVDEASVDMRPHTIRETVSRFTDHFVSVIVVGNKDSGNHHSGEYMYASKKLQSFVDALNRHFAEVEQNTQSEMSDE